MAALVGCVALASGRAAAQVPYLVKDVTPSHSLTPSSKATPLVVAGSQAFFTQQRAWDDTELWRTDGTSAGTTLVWRFVSLGVNAERLRTMVPVGNWVVFSAPDSQGDLEPWASDGTPEGTRRLLDINPTGSSSPDDFVSLGDVAVFTAATGTYAERSLWRTDGTAAGTYSLPDVVPGEFNNPPKPLGLAGGLLYFTVGRQYGDALWRTDGTAAGTWLLRDAVPGGYDGNGWYMEGVELSGTVLFKRDPYPDDTTEMWRSDGTVAGTYEVGVLTYACGSWFGAGDLVYGSGGDATTGTGELCRTDGTIAGTGLVKDLEPGTTSSYPRLFALLGDTLFFIAATEHGYYGSDTVWMSDGTAAGTQRIPGAPTVCPSPLSAMDGWVLFFFCGPSVGIARTDGTAAGTATIAYLQAETDHVVRLGDGALFWATDYAHGTELWRTDGTAAGTELLKEVTQRAVGLVGTASVNLDGTLLFTAGNALWRSDGTEAGTTSVHAPDTPWSPGGLMTTGGRMYFSANDAAHGVELWVSDGTPAGTALLKDLVPGLRSSSPSNLRPFDDGFLFTVYDGQSYGNQLWHSDGTPDGTMKLLDIASFVGPTVQLGRVALFSGGDPGSGRELWVTDGTTAGTAMLKDIDPGTASSSPGALTACGDLVFFVATEPATGTELWRSDGTEAGTWVIDINAGTASSSPDALACAGRTLLFAAEEPTAGRELWRSDGAISGTTLVIDLEPGPTRSAPEQVVAVGDLVFFTAQTNTYGRELWRSDGTAAGTALVRDLADGQDSLTLHNLTAFPSLGIVLFGATTREGTEPWMSDGTGDGTRALADIWPGSQSSNPRAFTVAGDRVYFSAEDRDHGRELWAIDRAALDRAGPEITPHITGTPGLAGWYVSDVTVTWTVSDPDSPVTSTAGCDPIAATADTAGVTLTCTATSGGGTNSRSIAIRRDASAPTVACAPVIVLEATAAAGANLAVVPVAVSDAMDAAPVVSNDAPGNGWFPLGTTAVTFTATDAAGNQASCASAIAVEDTTPPALSCPADVVLMTADPAGLVTTMPVATAMDAVDGPVPVTSSPPSPARLPVGRTDVTVTAADAAGNQATCGYAVEVVFAQQDAGPVPSADAGPGAPVATLCGCRAGASTGGAQWGPLLGLLALGLAGRSRRARREEAGRAR